MKQVKITVRTPRGNFQITKLFDSLEEATEAGYGFWFQHEKEYYILGKDNRVHAAVRVKK